MVLRCFRPGVLGDGQAGICGPLGVGSNKSPMSPRSASSKLSKLPGMSASSSPSAAKKADMSLSDMGAKELPNGSDWWRRCLDPPVPVLEPSDWFSELSLREFKVS